MRLTTLTAALFALLCYGNGCDSQAAILQLADTSSLSGDASSYMSITVGGVNIIGSENIGLYRMDSGAWVLCISPGGQVDYSPHDYTTTTIMSGSALNSPAWVWPGQAAAVWDTHVGQVISDGSKTEAWAFTASVYAALYDADVTFTASGVAAGMPSDFSRFNTAGGLHDAPLYVPVPGQNLAGQEFLVAVPEAGTWLAGLLAVGLVIPGRHRLKSG